MAMVVRQGQSGRSHHPLEPKIEQGQGLFAVFFLWQKDVVLGIEAPSRLSPALNGFIDAHRWAQADDGFVMLLGFGQGQSQIGLLGPHHLHMLVLEHFDVSGSHK